jgi:streptogramin lyase
MRRRQFLALAAAAPALGSVAVRRVSKVEIVFRSPRGSKPNGLQATEQGLWIMDQGEGNRVYLVRYEDGQVLRTLDTEADRASGITFDGEALWLASTYNRLIIRADPMTGKTIAKYVAPGAGPIYRMVGDPQPRSSPLAPAKPNDAAPQPRQPGPQQPPGGSAGTGAHGLEFRDGRLWMALPPSRTIFRVDPAAWIVDQKFATAANRPHGVGWEGKYLWCTDSNLNAFFKHDPSTGQIMEKIQLADNNPLPHGMSIWRGMLWYCDDVGVVCRLKL